MYLCPQFSFYFILNFNLRLPCKYSCFRYCNVPTSQRQIPHVHTVCLMYSQRPTISSAMSFYLYQSMSNIITPYIFVSPPVCVHYQNSICLHMSQSTSSIIYLHNVPNPYHYLWVCSDLSPSASILIYMPLSFYIIFLSPSLPLSFYVYHSISICLQAISISHLTFV